jgi:hypothetical protein
MNIHFILSIGSLLLMTIIPIVIYCKQWNKVIHTTLVSIWIIAVGTVYIYISIIFMLAD